MLICKYRTKQAIIGDAPSKAYLLEFGIVRPRKAKEEQSEFCAIFFFRKEFSQRNGFVPKDKLKACCINGDPRDGFGFYFLSTPCWI